jgi:uncharacterized protein YbaP (TraB family)
MEIHRRRAHVPDSGEFAAASIRKSVMLVMLKLLKTLSNAITEAKMQRIERELMLRGIPFPPFARPPHD